MTIYFGLALDDISYPRPLTSTGGSRPLGPQGLLELLESHLGLSGHPNDNDYLRIEHYRQALSRYLREEEGAFYAAAFRADQFATATELLSRRDELLLAGWDFEAPADAPPRLRCLAAIEASFRRETPLPPGYADRFRAVLQQLGRRRHPIRTLRLTEPAALLPPHFRQLLDTLADTGVTIEHSDPPTPEGESDLAAFQRLLLGEGKPGATLRADGSLLLLKAQRETRLAAFLASLCRHNPGFRPVCLVPEKNRTLDLAVTQEGLPSLGIPSASLARPTLQVLKLVTVFLWEPINPFKIMEFVSLAVKPLDDELANRIAEQMAQTPGLGSDSWWYMIRQYFEELDQLAAYRPGVNPQQVRKQYNFWFERRRYPSDGAAPKSEVIEIFAYLRQWAAETFDERNDNSHSLLVLTQQARRIVELLEALPETELTHLELERIVRTIYEPAPVSFAEERGRLPCLHQPAALTGEADELLWWNFVQNEQDYFFSRWYQPELRWLAQRSIPLPGPGDQNERLIRERKQPILRTRRRLLLVMPAMVEGSELSPHPLYGDLHAGFTNLDDITCDLDTGKGTDTFARFFRLPDTVEISTRQLGRPRPFLRIRQNHLLNEREKETFTSLESLFYYPYQWVFRHKIRLRKSSILSVVKDQTLMGNLAHRFFERLFREDLHNWDQRQLDRWIDREGRKLLQSEGAVLLMYGREPERINFLKRIKYAAWSLLNLIRNNGWEIEQTEMSIEGDFENVPVLARADLVLKKGEERAVIDLKWRGARRREDTIRNEEDLQLVLYSRLLDPPGNWAHTAYFIMENGRLIARNERAFRDITAVSPEADHAAVNERILRRMQATYRWRLEQVKRGEIEVRCTHTCQELDEHYGREALDLLEMPTGDAPFDDYRTLINLIE